MRDDKPAAFRYAVASAAGPSLEHGPSRSCADCVCSTLVEVHGEA